MFFFVVPVKMEVSLLCLFQCFLQRFLHCLPLPYTGFLSLSGGAAVVVAPKSGEKGRHHPIKALALTAVLLLLCAVDLVFACN